MLRFKKIAVIGAGIMGAGIAQRVASHSYRVVLLDTKEEYLKVAQDRITQSLDKLVEKGKISEDTKYDALALIEFVTDFNATASCELVIEAVNENPELKHKIFTDLDRICSPQTILATNTSSIPIASLAGVTERPGKVLGLHFMNPVPLIPLVEMTRSGQMSDDVFEACRDFVESVGCQVVESKDSPGFIINRILMPMINEAVRALESGIATAEDIDRAMVLGTKQPMGPLALADLIGLDTVVNILNTLSDGFEDERYRPCPLLLEHVQQNHLGRKTGRGFFEYEARSKVNGVLC
ncbi:MAG: 3-hydroxybutyryl-CoA dehydrogenase [Nitrospinae bacterium]|nr:3-hydroxybutyryl-CoA dehydrogenase [Nitrospinota bacterium]